MKWPGIFPVPDTTTELTLHRGLIRKIYLAIPLLVYSVESLCSVSVNQSLTTPRYQRMWGGSISALHPVWDV